MTQISHQYLISIHVSFQIVSAFIKGRNQIYCTVDFSYANRCCQGNSYLCNSFLGCHHLNVGTTNFFFLKKKKANKKIKKKKGIPWWPVVRTLHFAEGTGLIPGWGLCSRKPCGQKNKIRKKKKRIKTKMKPQTTLMKEV